MVIYTNEDEKLLDDREKLLAAIRMWLQGQKQKQQIKPNPRGDA